MQLTPTIRGPLRASPSFLAKLNMSTAFEHFLCRHFFYFYTLAFTEKIGTGDKSRYAKLDAVRIRYFGNLPNFWVSEKGFFLAWKERVFVGWHSKLGLYFSDFIRKQWKYTYSHRHRREPSRNLTAFSYSKQPIGGVVNLLLALLQK